MRLTLTAARGPGTRLTALLTAGAMAALVACSSGAGTGDDTPGTSPTTVPVKVDQEALTADVEELAAEMTAPGVVVLLKSPQGDFQLATGTTEVNGSTPVTMDDHVRIGSNTKTFTTTAILQLADEGKIDLEGPVSDYWSGVPNGKNITIAQLLNMRSGLYNYSETLKLNKALDEEPERVWKPRELLRMGLSRPVYFPPGEGWHYSNTNTVLLGLIAEKIEGEPLPQIIQDRFLTPLGLTSTSFPPSTTSAIPDPHPRGYMYSTNVLTMDGAELPPAQQEAAAAGTLLPNDVTDENPSWTWAAGQMIAGADDLATWAEALAEGSLLSTQMQEARLLSLAPANDSLPAGSVEYGYGIAKLGPMYGHTGELPGFNSFMGHDPQKDVTLIVWSNLGSAPNGEPVATTIARSIITRIYPTPPEPEPSGS